MLDTNERFDEALAFVQDADCDVMCLQEVPPKFFALLQSLPDRHLASTIDEELGSPSTRMRRRLVLLSRFAIKDQQEFPLPNHERSSLRKTLFLSVMRYLGFSWRSEGGEGRHALFARLDTPHGVIQFINLHLTLASTARHRVADMRTVLERMRTPAVICGDFNTLESPLMTPLNWLLGGAIPDALFWKRERRDMETLFAAHDLANPLRGRVTRPLTRSQLDHILIPRDWYAQGARVDKERHGSDHCPVSIECHP